MKPVNGRILVEVKPPFKHASVQTGKAFQDAVCEGVVVAISEDLRDIVTKALGGWPYLWTPETLIGKKVRWDRFADQHSKFSGIHSKSNNLEVELALVKWEDITLYEPID